LQETPATLNETRATLQEKPATLQEAPATLNETRATLHASAEYTKPGLLMSKRYWHDVKVTSITADMENVVLTSAQRHCVYCVISQLIENKLKKI